MNEIHFFDLPVYRLSPEEYALAWEKAISAERDRINGKSDFVIPDSMDQRIRLNRYHRYGEWRFNEVIAYIRLNFRGSQLLATYHSAEKKRNPISRSKVFTKRSRGITYKLSVGSTNTEIWTIVKDFVEACKKLKKNRFIDDSTLMRIGPHMDWQSLRRQC